MIFGIILIIIGVVFLLQNLGYISGADAVGREQKLKQFKNTYTELKKTD